MAEEENRAAILGKEHKCAQDRRIWGLAAVPASCRLLHPRANTPCLSVALCSAGVILAGRTLWGVGGVWGLSTRLSLLLSLLLSHPMNAVTHLHLFTPIRSLGLCIPPQSSFHPSVHMQTVLLWTNPCPQIHAPICLARSPDLSTCRHQARFAQAAQCCNPDNLYPLNKASQFSLPCN